MSFRAITRILASEGILTPSAVKQRTPRTATSRPTDWNAATLTRIISNPVYLGKLVYGRSRKVISTSYDVNIYDSTRLIAFPTFARKGEAKRFCEALAAAAPQVQTGKDKEEKAFLKSLEEAKTSKQ
jgi:hypothetical protein